MVLSILVIRHI